MNPILIYAVAFILRIASRVSVPSKGLYFGLLSNPIAVVPDNHWESSKSTSVQVKASDSLVGILVFDGAPLSMSVLKLYEI